MAGTPSVASRPVAFSLEPLGDTAALEAGWCDLAERAQASFFQGWGWIGCWLRQLPASRPPLLLRGTAGSRTVVLGLFVRRPAGGGLARRSALHLHATGGEAVDAITIERNGLLLDPGMPGLLQASLEWLADRASWDALHLPGIASGQLAALRRLGMPVRIVDRKPTFVTALAAPDDTGLPIPGLSANMRYQLRRALRLHARRGPLGVAAATGPGEALEMLQALKLLHQRSWEARGRPGAFAVPAFEDFHRRLIADRFSSGEVQLLRIAAGGEAIGYLYNLVRGARVLSYQSGFDYSGTAAHKPGLVCHALAMQWNRERGAVAYDLLAGANQLKRCIAQQADELCWAVVRRPRLSVRIETWVRQAADYLSRRRQLSTDAVENS
jgi:CelD/BcsL family acetyltransferase involved in cellulose biosynthesis